MNILTLDWKGALLGLAIAVALLFLGGNAFGLFFVLSMLYFLIISAVATYVGKESKLDIHLYQKSRGTRNVIANGVPALVFAAAFYLSSVYGMHAFAMLAVVGFVSSVAAVTSDKFSSELGVLDGVPKSIVSFRPVRKGVSGGVTPLGLAAGLAGAMLISLALVPLPLIGGAIRPDIAIAGIAVIVAGFAGTIVDSVLGYFEEKGIGTKYSTNFACGVVGGVVGMLLYYAVFA